MSQERLQARKNKPSNKSTTINVSMNFQMSKIPQTLRTFGQKYNGNST